MPVGNFPSWPCLRTSLRTSETCRFCTFAACRPVRRGRVEPGATTGLDFGRGDFCAGKGRRSASRVAESGRLLSRAQRIVCGGTLPRRPLCGAGPRIQRETAASDGRLRAGARGKLNRGRTRCCEDAAHGVGSARNFAAAGAANLHRHAAPRRALPQAVSTTEFSCRRRKGRGHAFCPAKSGGTAQSLRKAADTEERENGSRRRSGFMRRKRARALPVSGWKRSRKPRSEKGPGLFCGGGAANYFRLKTRRTVSTACMVYSGLAASWKRSFMKEMGS